LAVLALAIISAAAAAAAADAAAAAETPAPQIQVGVYPFLRTGQDPAFAKLESFLKGKMSALPGIVPVDLAAGVPCDAEDTECLAAAGSFSGVDRVVRGAVEKFGDAYAVSLQLVDVATGEHSEVKRVLQGGPDDLLGGMEAMACEIAAQGPCTGRLSVETSAGGGELWLDGKNAGFLPAAEPLVLAVGRHAVRVARGALSTPERRVTVSYGQTLELHAQTRGNAFALDDGPLPQPVAASAAAPDAATAGAPLAAEAGPKILPWIFAGAAAVAVGLGGFFGNAALQDFHAADTTDHPEQVDPLAASAAGKATAANLLYAGAAAAAAGAVLTFVF
jgi:hypothetical protein